MLKILVASNIFCLFVWVFLTVATIIPSEVKSDITTSSSFEELKLELWGQKVQGFYEGFNWGMGGATLMLVVNILNLVCIIRVIKYSKGVK